jgi:acyl-CoA thioesterase-2
MSASLRGGIGTTRLRPGDGSRAEGGLRFRYRAEVSDPTLLDLLTLEQTGPDRFRAEAGPTVEIPHLYGGRVAAQALVAAGRTVPTGWLPHSLHAYFLRAGRSDVPTEFQVIRDRDGRSYAARRVEARQDGELLFHMLTSLGSDTSSGPDWQPPNAYDPAPPTGLEVFGTSHLPSVETRVAAFHDQWGMPTHLWHRLTIPFPDDPLLHLAGLTYVSDSYNAFGSGPGVPASGVGASLDHAMWFRRPVRLDHWFYVAFEPTSVGSGRGLYRGTLWQDEAVVANLGQEIVYRHPRV